MNWYKIAKSKRKWENVDSSFIRSISYNDSLKVLSVKLLGDKVWNYKDVPKYMYENMLKAESQGKYFNKYIKDNFNYTRGGK